MNKQYIKNIDYTQYYLSHDEELVAFVISHYSKVYYRAHLDNKYKIGEKPK